MLTRDQVEFFNENGYVVVKGLFSKDEAAMYRKECHDLAERLGKIRNIESQWGSAIEVTEKAKDTHLLHCHDVQFYSSAFARMISDERLAGAAASLIGNNVQLHHTKMFIKPPEKGSPFPMHQDYPFFPHENNSMIAAILHFDDAPLIKGCVRVVPGSHKLGPLPHIPEGSWHLSPQEYPVASALPVPAEAGDVLFFSYLTIHGSGINESNEARTTVLVQMRDPADPPSVRTHESRGQGMMLHGVDPTSCTVKPASETKECAAPMGGPMAGPMGGPMSGR